MAVFLGHRFHNDVAIVTGVSPDWICSLSEITEKSLMDDRRIATIARSETGKSEADDVIAAIHSMAQRDASALRLSLPDHAAEQHDQAPRGHPRGARVCGTAVA